MSQYLIHAALDYNDDMKRIRDDDFPFIVHQNPDGELIGASMQILVVHPFVDWGRSLDQHDLHVVFPITGLEHSAFVDNFHGGFTVNLSVWNEHVDSILINRPWLSNSPKGRIPPLRIGSPIWRPKPRPWWKFWGRK